MSEHVRYGQASPGRSTSHRSDLSRNLTAFDTQTVGTEPQSYRFGRSAPRDLDHRDETMPIFSSDGDHAPAAEAAPYDDETYDEILHDHEPSDEEFWPTRQRRMSLSSRVLLAVVLAASVAMMFALVTSDATRDLIVSAKASIIGAPQDPTVPAQLATTQLTARDMQLNEPARQPPTITAMPVQTAAANPSSEDIANAFQSAVQARAAIEPVVAAPLAQPPARRMDPDELAGIIKRAKSLLASGDIPSARLLLERAAEAQEPSAALMLAQTYDPRVLGTQDIRNITADSAVARVWYQRAAQYGSAEAHKRLELLQN